MESMVHRERWERDTPECDCMGTKRPYNSLNYTERRSQLVFQKDTRKRTPHRSQQFPPQIPKRSFSFPFQRPFIFFFIDFLLRMKPAGQHSPRSCDAISHSYSSGCDKKGMESALRVLSLPRKEYCSLSSFRKEGNGMILFFDVNGREKYSLFCTWSAGELTGPSYLYSIEAGSVVSVYTFYHDELVECEDVFIPASERCIVDGENGRRWEGPLFDEMLFNTVEEYNEDNVLVFRGSYFRNRRCGFGEEYYDFPLPYSVPVSRGFCIDDKWLGSIELFDRNGDYVRDQTVINNINVYPDVMVDSLPNVSISTITENITISDGVELESECFDLSDWISLRSLHIGKCCFTRASCFILHCLPLLRCVEIGESSLLSLFRPNRRSEPYAFKPKSLRSEGQR